MLYLVNSQFEFSVSAVNNLIEKGPQPPSSALSAKLCPCLTDLVNRVQTSLSSQTWPGLGVIIITVKVSSRSPHSSCVDSDQVYAFSSPDLQPPASNMAAAQVTLLNKTLELFVERNSFPLPHLLYAFR